MDDRLERLIKNRDDLAAKVQRLKGRLDTARSNLASLEAECRARGVEPDKLDEIISTLEGRYNDLLSRLEREIQEAHEALRPYLEVQ